MEIESKIKASLARLGEQLNEQQWYQELRSKWEELDPQSKVYLKVAGIGGAAIAFLAMVVSSLVSVSSLKSDFNDRNELLATIRNATDEIRTLKRANQGPQGSNAAEIKWGPYFTAKALSNGIDGSRVVVSPEKPGNAGGTTTESMFSLELNRVNIKQAVQYAFALEGGPEPVKVKNLRIQTVGDEGWLNAKLEVSAFALKKEKEGK